MRHVRVAGALILGSLSSLLAATSAEAQELSLRRILLTTGGVGYFEHEATVAGDATLSLDVRLDQVSDVLKSIVVFDEQGRMGSASLEGREPLSEVFRDLPFNQADLTSPAALMRALRGSEVRISVHGTTLQGRIISVTEEKTVLPDGQGTIVRNRITLMSGAGIRQVLLEEADAIEIVDPKLRTQVETALVAIAEHGASEKRTITIHALGQGERKVRVGYVVSAPLWKATYRLVLPNAQNPARIEGFALLENMSGHDWVGVNLSVASGNPVTFRQALYEAYFVTRPEVPVEVFGRILPPVDVGAVPPAAAGARAMSKFMRSAPADAAIPESLAVDAGEAPGVPTLAEANEGATAVVFHFPNPIDLERGQALLAPIIQRNIRAERVSVFRREVATTNPVASVRLVNDTETSLPPGAIATYERRDGGLEFVGDAQLGPLPVGQERLLGYAADLEVRVDFEDQFAQTTTGARIERGVLVVRRVERRRTTYRIAGAADEPRTVIIEHPRVQGFALVAPPVLGDTPAHHRLRQEVLAGQTVALDVVLERPLEERIVIGVIPVSELGVLAASSEMPEPVRVALTRVAELQRTLVDRQEALTALESERTRVVADQERLRANLEAAPAGSDLRTRYLTALAETEDRIEALDQSLAAAREGVTMAKNELEEFIASLTI